MNQKLVSSTSKKRSFFQKRRITSFLFYVGLPLVILCSGGGCEDDDEKIKHKRRTTDRNTNVTNMIERLTATGEVIAGVPSGPLDIVLFVDKNGEGHGTTLQAEELFRQFLNNIDLKSNLAQDNDSDSETQATTWDLVLNGVFPLLATTLCEVYNTYQKFPEIKGMFNWNPRIILANGAKVRHQSMQIKGWHSLSLPEKCQELQNFGNLDNWIATLVEKARDDVMGKNAFVDNGSPLPLEQILAFLGPALRLSRVDKTKFPPTSIHLFGVDEWKTPPSQMLIQYTFSELQLAPATTHLSLYFSKTLAKKNFGAGIKSSLAHYKELQNMFQTTPFFGNKETVRVSFPNVNNAYLPHLDSASPLQVLTHSLFQKDGFRNFHKLKNSPEEEEIQSEMCGTQPADSFLWTDAGGGGGGCTTNLQANSAGALPNLPPFLCLELKSLGTDSKLIPNTLLNLINASASASAKIANAALKFKENSLLEDIFLLSLYPATPGNTTRDALVAQVDAIKKGQQNQGGGGTPPVSQTSTAVNALKEVVAGSISLQGGDHKTNQYTYSYDATTGILQFSKNVLGSLVKWSQEISVTIDSKTDKTESTQEDNDEE